jgi:hypothetical protein
MVPESFAARGKQSYLEFWAITNGLWYPGYITPTHIIKSCSDLLALSPSQGLACGPPMSDQDRRGVTHITTAPLFKFGAKIVEVGAA